MFTKKIADIQARRAAGEKGFTLVELLVVVVIIAVLAAIAVPIFLNQRAGAEKSAWKSSTSAISNGIKTAASTGGNVVKQGDAILITDGAGATVTVPIPDNGTVFVKEGTAAAAELGATAVKPTAWCVSVGADGVFAKMSNSDSAPVDDATTACTAGDFS